MGKVLFYSFTASTAEKKPTSKPDEEEEYVPPEPEKKVLIEEGSEYEVK